jgi:hypothetical protein
VISNLWLTFAIKKRGIFAPLSALVLNCGLNVLVGGAKSGRSLRPALSLFFLSGVGNVFVYTSAPLVAHSVDKQKQLQILSDLSKRMAGII